MLENKAVAYTQEQLHEDLAYLIDELGALKPLANVVPVHEKPGDELSIAEIFIAIGLAQKEVLNDARTANFDEVISQLKATSSSDAAHNDINDILDDIINVRTQLLNSEELLKGKAQTLTDLVLFERNQLRFIAERILTINSED